MSQQYLLEDSLAGWAAIAGSSRLFLLPEALRCQLPQLGCWTFNLRQLSSCSLVLGRLVVLGINSSAVRVAPFFE